MFPHVAILIEGHGLEGVLEHRNTFILVASKTPLDWDRIRAAHDPRFGLTRLGDAFVDDLLERCGQRLLTDDWAPWRTSWLRR